MFSNLPFELNMHGFPEITHTCAAHIHEYMQGCLVITGLLESRCCQQHPAVTTHAIMDLSIKRPIHLSWVEGNVCVHYFIEKWSINVKYRILCLTLNISGVARQIGGCLHLRINLSKVGLAFTSQDSLPKDVVLIEHDRWLQLDILRSEAANVYETRKRTEREINVPCEKCILHLRAQLVTKSHVCSCSPLP